MPELPEVETSRRGVEPFLVGERIDNIIVREKRLRWPVRADVSRELTGQTVGSVTRRAKYLLINTGNGSAMIHLGMSGSVYIVDRGTPATVHEHFDIDLGSGKTLRYRDPRRFGSLHWSRRPDDHKLIRSLGPEPLGEQFSGEYLWDRAHGRSVAVKQFIMNANIVVGVGNIYASEALFLAGISPLRAAGRIARHRYDTLAGTIQQVLQKAIKAGGTTLRDFYGGNGEAGYFKHELTVYDRKDQPCITCKHPISAIVIGQRSSYYCKKCQR